MSNERSAGQFSRTSINGNDTTWATRRTTKPRKLWVPGDEAPKPGRRQVMDSVEKTPVILSKKKERSVIQNKTRNEPMLNTLDPTPAEMQRQSRGDEAITTVAAAPTAVTDKTAKPNPRDLHKKKLKTLLSDLQRIEMAIAKTAETAQQLAFFNHVDNDYNALHDRTQQTHRARQHTLPVLSDNDIRLATALWHEKMTLHLSLADKYLELIQTDYAFAEKKSLESLCWKRAIYSLVEQFRHAFKLYASNADASEQLSDDNDDPDDHNNTSTTQPTDSTAGTDNATLDEDRRGALTPIWDNLRACFFEFLDKADGFYRRLGLALLSLDEAEAQSDRETFLASTEEHLQEWRRTKRLKWYKCIPNRGDLARYRWAFTAGEDAAGRPLHISRKAAFEEAWQWYALGVWLMPATGKLYFHLSLLMNHGAHRRESHALHDMHMLYFSIRSLMVRRNGFLNAREGIIILFERNRRWTDKYLEALRTSEPKQRSRPKSKNKELKKHSKTESATGGVPAVVPEEAATGLFMRLHSMMFTKIGLDQFAEVKRRFFDTLFPDQHDGHLVKEHTPSTQTVSLGGSLSSVELFWFEAALLGISSLYTYDYPSSKLNKLIILNWKRVFDTSSTGSHPVGETERSDDQPTAGRPKAQKQESYESLLEELKDSLLFSYGIDLLCQIATELMKRHLDPSLPSPLAPKLPHLSSPPAHLRDNFAFIFEQSFAAKQEAKAGGDTSHDENHDGGDNDDSQAWLIFIEILLQWMVVNGICVRPKHDKELDDTATRPSSLWESLVGNIAADLLGYREDVDSKISPVFWSLLLQLLNHLLQSLPEDLKYDLINRYLLDSQDEDNDAVTSDQASALGAFECRSIQLLANVLGKVPVLPEETQLRGLGWVDDATGKLLKATPYLKQDDESPLRADNLGIDRKLKILEYGFTLVKQMDELLYYDPVMETFTAAKNVEQEVEMLVSRKDQGNETRDLWDGSLDGSLSEQDNPIGNTILEMDDAVLFSNETDKVDDDGDDDILTQLKKRCEQLQAMLTNIPENGNHRMPARLKERQVRMNRLRERVIPGQTALVLDTNCFIGHLEHVKSLILQGKWLIVVPLVVITELDGLSGNAPPLGRIAGDALKFIENHLATKQRGTLRIQTSHHNFMYDISIRSEQFVFGESDKNLDDLVLSTCIWWAKRDKQSQHAPVCLVTGDRNLSVKARARDIDVVSVSAIMQL